MQCVGQVSYIMDKDMNFGMKQDRESAQTPRRPCCEAIVMLRHLCHLDINGFLSGAWDATGEIIKEIQHVTDSLCCLINISNFLFI